jgi:hypothetical protein
MPERRRKRRERRRRRGRRRRKRKRINRRRMTSKIVSFENQLMKKESLIEHATWRWGQMIDVSMIKPKDLEKK